MKYIFILFLFIGESIDPTEIAKINAIKSAAEKAYLAGDFEKSILKYAQLLDSMNIEDESATLNMAHAFRQSNKTDEAIKYYQRLQDAKDESLKSVAYQQLGALTDDPKELENALSYFKEAIKSDPSNDDARYNYEMLKKKMKEQQNDNKDKGDNKEEQEDKDKDNQDENKEGQEKKDKDKEGKGEEKKEGEEDKEEEKKDGEEKEGEDGEEKKEEEGKEGEKSEEEKKKEQEEKEGKEQEEKKDEEKDGDKQPPSTSDKLKEMNISEEKAKMILEALKNNEIQYIQQNRRKATKRKNNDKPDW